MSIKDEIRKINEDAQKIINITNEILEFKLDTLSKSSVVSEPTEDEIFNKLPKFWFIGGSKKSTSMPYEIAKATAKTIYELYHPKAR